MLSKHPNCSTELLTLLWDEYLKKKGKVADKVSFNLIAHNTKVITSNAAKATTNSRSYWNRLNKLNKSSNYPLCIKDPVNAGVIIDDPLLIKKKTYLILVKSGKT